MEITELDLNDSGFGRSSSNFGGGLELLMNDKVRESSRPTSDIDLDDLNKLENELNDLVEDIPSSGFSAKSDFFDKPSVSFSDEPGIRLNFDDNLGKATSDTENDNKTWDGYGKFNNIPLNPDKPVLMEPKLSKEEMLREKFKYLRKLEALEKKGIELSKKYSMDSSLQEMMGEYETIMEEKSKQNSVKFQGNMLMAIINGIEFLNNKFDPFDVKLDGWSENVMENVNDYDEVFEELHDKYSDSVKMAPELKLLAMVAGSGFMFHLTNSLFKSAAPKLSDILKQNPDIAKNISEAAARNMGNTINQEFGAGDFLGNMMKEGIQMKMNQGQGPQQGPQRGPPVGPQRPSSQDPFAAMMGQRPAGPPLNQPKMTGPVGIDELLSELSSGNNNNNNNNNNFNSRNNMRDDMSVSSAGSVTIKSSAKRKNGKKGIQLDIN